MGKMRESKKILFDVRLPDGWELLVGEDSIYLCDPLGREYRFGLIPSPTFLDEFVKTTMEVKERENNEKKRDDEKREKEVLELKLPIGWNLKKMGGYYLLTSSDGKKRVFGLHTTADFVANYLDNECDCFCCRNYEDN